MGRPTWADRLSQGYISAHQIKLLARGLNPWGYSQTRSYSPLRVRRKRLYNARSRRHAAARLARLRRLQAQL